jgi:hypothetical protein
MSNTSIMTAREFMLFEALKEIKAKKTISVDDLDAFIYQVEKLLMNYRDAVESRDNWRKKYTKLKNGN